MWDEIKLNELLSRPSDVLVEDIRRLGGEDILVIGAGGKMGPPLCVLAKRAIELAGTGGRVLAASRFSDAVSRGYMDDNGIKCVDADLLDPEQVKTLPSAKNII